MDSTVLIALFIGRLSFGLGCGILWDSAFYAEGLSGGGSESSFDLVSVTSCLAQRIVSIVPVSDIGDGKGEAK